MKKLLLTYFIFLLLMFLYKGFFSNKQQLRPESLKYGHHQRILNKLPQDQKKYFNLLVAFTVGDTSGLKNLKSGYKKLGLVHLFTPSGFHFQAILYLFSFSLLKRWKKLLLLFSVLIFFLPGFEALKRIVALKNVELHPKWTPTILKNRYVLFLVIFALFFLLGDFARNPLSFSFSFLFLGVIYAQEEMTIRSWILVFWGLFFAQLLVQIFFPMNISLSSFFIGYLLGILFNILFPMMIVFYLLIISGVLTKALMIYVLFPVKFFHLLVLQGTKIQFTLHSFSGTFVIVFLITGLVLQVLPFSKFSLKLKFLFFITLLFSQSINQKVRKPKTLRYPSAMNFSNYPTIKKTSEVKSDNSSTKDEQKG